MVYVSYKKLVQLILVLDLVNVLKLQLKTCVYKINNHVLGLQQELLQHVKH